MHRDEGDLREAEVDGFPFELDAEEMAQIG
jgi:hypothetical protein